MLLFTVGARFLPTSPSQQALDSTALAVLGLGWLLAWRFRSGRIALALALLTLADSRFPVIAGRYLGAGEPWAWIWSWILAVDLACLSWLEEAPVFSRRSAWRTALLAAQIGIGAALAYSPVARQALLPADEFSAWAGWLALALAAIVFLLRGGPVEAGLFWVILLLAGARVYVAPEHLIILLASILALATLEMAFGLAWRDELTGLPSRRALNGALNDLGGSYAVAMIDVDHFKRFNDRHGHDVGDQVLRRVAAELAKAGRAFRYGGEEFALIFPGSSAKDARPGLEELLKAVEERAFVLRSRKRPKRRPKKRSKSVAPKKLKVTVSIGVADNAKGREPEDVVKLADKALYRAKRAGRNRVEGGGGKRRVAPASTKS